MIRKQLAGEEIREAGRAFLKGRDTDCEAHLKNALALLKGKRRGLS